MIRYAVAPGLADMVRLGLRLPRQLRPTLSLSKQQSYYVKLGVQYVKTPMESEGYCTPQIYPPRGKTHYRRGKNRG